MQVILTVAGKMWGN